MAQAPYSQDQAYFREPTFLLAEKIYHISLIYLHKDLFSKSLGHIMAVFLHELSHSLGHDDGSREFSDSLTILIQKCIDNNHSVKKYSREWDKGFKLS